MKLWQKIFLLTLTLVIIVVNATSLILLTNNHSLAIEREQHNAIARHDYLVAEIQNSIIYTQLVQRSISLTDEAALGVAFDVMDRQRGDATVGVTLFEEGAPVHSVNVQPKQAEIALLPQPDYSSNIVVDAGRTYLLLVSSLTLNDRPYRLVSSYDISSAYTLFEKDFDQVRIVGIVSALLVAGILLALVRLLLNPLRNLSSTTRQIAEGDLEKRVLVRGNDEVSEVGRNLNTMADSIEHNITELANLAEKRRVFIGNLAHEMKTPLTSILGFADLLRVQREVSEENRVEYANVIVAEARRLQGLSGKLMELLTMGNTQLTLERIDLHELADDLAVSLQPIFANQGLKLSLRLPRQEVFIVADRELLKSLIYNLVDNAIKASSPGSTIVFAVERGSGVEGTAAGVSAGVSAGATLAAATPGAPAGVPAGATGAPRATAAPAAPLATADEITQNQRSGDAVIVAIVDEGVGIPLDQIPLLTEPFYMLDKARTRKAGGAGLGLALCAEIARAHGSRLCIESELGRGTRVSVAFAPTAPGVPAAPGAPTAPAAPATPTAPTLTIPGEEVCDA
jgi:signal transduction histidine kinase